VDAAGNLYIAEMYQFRVRKVAPDGTIATIAGNGMQGYSGDGGPATSARLGELDNLAVDASGNVYVADTTNNAVRILVPSASPSCHYGIDQTTAAVPGAGATLPISIQTAPTCQWAVLGLPVWITSENSGRGTGTVHLAVAPNPAVFRAATISIAGTAVTIAQGGGDCRYSLGSGVATFTAADSAGSEAVTADPGCPWTASAAAL
jgi:hypothetical protein